MTFFIFSFFSFFFFFKILQFLALEGKKKWFGKLYISIFSHIVYVSISSIASVILIQSRRNSAFTAFYKKNKG